MQSLNQALALADQASTSQTWRISLDGASKGSGSQLLSVKEPANLDVYATEVPLEEAVAASASEILVTWSPPAGAKIDVELERWVMRDNPPFSVVRAGLRTIRVIWCDSHALIWSAEEHRAEAIDAVVRFALCIRTIESLEKRMEAMWATLDGFKDLSHAVKRGDQKRQAAVSAATEQALQMQVDILRVQSALEQVDARLPTTSKRLFAELTLQGALYDRLEVIEDPVEFATNHLEMANTRLIEAKAARETLILEVLILLVIVATIIPVLYK